MKDSQQKSVLTPRQHALYRLIKHNSMEELRKTTQKEICEQLKDYGYVYNESVTCHDRCSIIWSDINAINNSFEKEKLIISDNFTYWIGNKEENEEYLDKLWEKLSPRLYRYWTYKRKIERDGQGKLLSVFGNPIDENSKAREFVESFNPFRVEEKE